MPVGSLYTAKDQASTYLPLLLATITFSDGTVLRVSTHDLTGAAQYGGNSYLPYILNKQIATTQALGEQGIDIPASVNLILADSDLALWANYELLHGFKGSRLELRAVMWDVLANDYSSDSRVIFRGICKEPGGKLPQHNGKTLTIGYSSLLNMTDLSLPAIRVQRTCPWIFPSTGTQRQDGADNADSPFFRCGYSPDASGGNARGNLNSGSPFTTCGFTKTDCIARGMYTQDSSSRMTGRFGGIQWNPPDSTQNVRNYITGQWREVKADPNSARYGDYVPMLWGRAWTDPLVINTIPDGNFVKMEALVCFGEVDAIFDVVVNDFQIPHIFGDSEAPISTGPGVPNATEAFKGGWWRCTNRGDRDGSPTNDLGYTDRSGVPQGDPYGSYCVLEIAVPYKVAAPGSLPRVRVLAERGVRYGYAFAFPSDIQKDILRNWAGWEAAEINSGSFDDSFDLDSEAIPTLPTGTASRFTSSLYLRQPESIADILRGLRNSRRGIIGPDASGLLRSRTKQTLSDQQPSPVSGSNYNDAITSKLANGTAADGYAAYRFDESNIIGQPSISLTTAGNRFAISFNNAGNRHSQDALQVIDSEDILRSDREIPGSFSVRGADSFDQIKRLVATFAAEQLRGNPRGDTGGSVVIDIEASFRAVHLSVGDICVVNFELFGLADQLFRVTRITPDSNFEKARLSLSWHNDDWYVDSFGQSGIPTRTSRHRDRLSRPAFPWLPNEEQPATGDSMQVASEWGFAVSQRYEQDGGGETSLAKLIVTGKHPVNAPVASPAPPFVPIQGTTSSSGGSLAGGRTYYVALSAKDSDGNLSALSSIVLIAVPSGSTNTITVPGIEWDPSTSGYAVFAGTIPGALSFQAEASGTPGSVTLTSLSVALSGPPDGEFDHLRVRVKPEVHGGVWGAQVAAVTSTTIQIAVADPGFTTDQWAGRDVTLFAKLGSTARLPIATFRVASNNTDTLTLAPGSPDPTALGLGVGDVLVMRVLPTFGSDINGTYVEDTNWQNCFSPDGMIPGAEAGLRIRFISGTGRGQVVKVDDNTETRHYAKFPVQPDATSRYVIEPAAWTVIRDTDSAVANSDPAATITAEVDVTNIVGQSLLVQVLTVDGGGNESIEALSPIRELYLEGQGLVWTTIDEDTELTPDDRAVLVDISAGPVTVALAPILSGRRRGRKTIIKRSEHANGNAVTILPSSGNTIEGGALFQMTEPGDCSIWGDDGA